MGAMIEAHAVADHRPKAAGPRILVDYHGVTPPEMWGPHNREALEKGIRQRGLVWCADAVLAHSTFTLRELGEPCGFPAERIYRLGYPIDVRHFSPGDATAWRGSLGVGDSRLLLHVGRLAPNKRVPLLVEAGWLDLVDHLWFVKTTPDVALQRLLERGHSDGVGLDEYVAFEYAKVRRFYAQLGIADRTEIEFFTGGHEIHLRGTMAFLRRHLNFPEK